MPAIRDAVFSQEAVTTDAGLTIPMCDYAEGDLLFAVAIGDTGAPTWGCSNGIGTWTQLFAQNNSASVAVYWKYAAASGEGNVVFTSTVNETYCGYVCSVRDAYQGYTGGSPPLKSNTTQASSTRFTMPTITTTDDDSLVLFVNGNTGANSTLLTVEGGAISQLLIHGAAESGSLGWTVKPAAGLTEAVVVSVASAGAGVKATIEVRAPVAGAAEVPAYAASDDSVVLVVTPGAVYNGSTALAATADTNFGTSLGGVTANDATVATGTVDVGVDPKGFQLSCSHTNAANATAISGSECVVPAGVYNIGDANILGHVRSVSTVASQNLGAIGTGRGMWFGMKSGATAATDLKIWQVHGGDAPYYGVAVVPFVISNANPDTRVSVGALSNSDVRRYGFWSSGVGVLTGALNFGSLWKMGTTVVAGGTIGAPIGIEGLEFALTKGKQRWSAIRQGANQLLCLQAVQFGNGGTNPVVLGLDSAAVEFPSQRNQGAKLVNYNGADNSVGFTYYPGAADTIVHRASVISSPSPYHWRIHASASASAAYDFEGLSIIGAGDVVLRAVTIFSAMAFTRCPAIAQNGAALAGCSFADSHITADDPADISGCTFTSGGAGHAIALTTPGTYTFTANQFAGYGAGGTTDAAIYNNSGGAVTLNIGGGGSTPTVRNGAGASTTVNNAVTVTVEASASLVGAEVRIYDLDGTLPNLGTELAGTESCPTASFAFSTTAGNDVWIQIMQAGFEEFGQAMTVPATNAPFPALLSAETN